MLLSEAGSTAYIYMGFFFSVLKLYIVSSDKPVLFCFRRNVSEVLSDLCLKYLQNLFSVSHTVKNSYGNKSKLNR